MGQAALDYKKSKKGLDINGIIQDYYVYAGETVNAGDFVTFVNGIAESTLTLVSTSPVQLHSRNILDIKSILLDENKVFIIVQDDSTNYGYAKIATISNGTITLGTDYQILSSAISNISITKVTSSKVAISFVTSYIANAIIANVSGTTITFGSAVSLGEGTSSYPDASTSIVALTSNYLVVAWNRNDTANNATNTSRGLRACVLYTSGTTSLSKYTMFNLPRNGTNQYLSLCAVNSTTATLAYKAGNSSGSTVYMFVLQRSSGTLTAGDDTQVSSAIYSRQICSCLINTDTVLIVHGVAASSSSYSAYGRTAYVSGTTVTLGTREALNTGKYVEYTGVGLLETNKAVISYYNSNTTTGIMLIATMSGTNSRIITLSENYTFAENTIITTTTPCVLNPNTVLVTYGTNLQVNTKGQLFSIDGTNITNEVETLAAIYETQVKKATTLPYNGVASTSGEGGSSTAHKDVVSVYVPDL